MHVLYYKYGFLVSQWVKTKSNIFVLQKEWMPNLKNALQRPHVTQLKIVMDKYE